MQICKQNKFSGIQFIPAYKIDVAMFSLIFWPYISFVLTGVVVRMLNTRARGYKPTEKKSTLFYCELEQYDLTVKIISDFLFAIMSSLFGLK